uniref:Mitogen-activated protein kinase kinase kinase 7 n=2 Tax=Tetraselmis sp. GSL018 TaxID=582737 RepID=A0A061QQN4_9CHLO|eukprot:CAMPEP_0177616944 /NCGR_PEP_ID=MMETSP0419_2-20121207/24537_1 /TAXON_ID=582737 /ORGANISM="Tetraselmis sp., Strain GSL018" /LENGTH=1510 /DNA_ID=CAMNT_0019115259 /DNA_START=191 /DNA_END=4723 /DNA_ORIENTATION=+
MRHSRLLSAAVVLLTMAISLPDRCVARERIGPHAGVGRDSRDVTSIDGLYQAILLGADDIVVRVDIEAGDDIRPPVGPPKGQTAGEKLNTTATEPPSLGSAPTGADPQESSYFPVIAGQETRLVCGAAGGAWCTLAGEGRGQRAFRVGRGGTLRVEGFRLSGWAAPSGGGAILVDEGGTVFLRDCELTNNSAGGDTGGVPQPGGLLHAWGGSPIPLAQAGGAVLVAGGAALEAENVTFAGNSAGEGSGGAVAVLGRLSRLRCLGCAFRDNRAGAAGGAITAGGAGAGVALRGGSFQQNHASLAGGAVAAVAGARVEIDGSAFRRNQAQGSGGAVAVGGAGALLVAKACTFASNSGGSGGALALEDGATGRLEACDLVGSSAASGGGAVAMARGASLVLLASEVSGSAALWGGAVDAAGADTRLELDDGCLLADNEAGTSGGHVSARSGALAVLRSAALERGRALGMGGGALHVADGAALVGLGLRVQGNSAESGAGGGLLVTNGTAVLEGGGLLRNWARLGGAAAVSEDGNLVLYGGHIGNVQLQDNTASQDGLDIYVSGGSLFVRRARFAGGTPQGAGGPGASPAALADGAWVAFQDAEFEARGSAAADIAVNDLSGEEVRLWVSGRAAEVSYSSGRALEPRDCAPLICEAHVVGDTLCMQSSGEGLMNGFGCWPPSQRALSAAVPKLTPHQGGGCPAEQPPALEFCGVLTFLQASSCGGLYCDAVAARSTPAPDVSPAPEMPLPTDPLPLDTISSDGIGELAEDANEAAADEIPPWLLPAGPGPAASSPPPAPIVSSFPTPPAADPAPAPLLGPDKSPPGGPGPSPAAATSAETSVPLPSGSGRPPPSEPGGVRQTPELDPDEAPSAAAAAGDPPPVPRSPEGTTAAMDDGSRPSSSVPDKPRSGNIAAGPLAAIIIGSIFIAAIVFSVAGTLSVRALLPAHGRGLDSRRHHPLDLEQAWYSAVRTLSTGTATMTTRAFLARKAPLDPAASICSSQSSGPRSLIPGGAALPRRHAGCMWRTFYQFLPCGKVDMLDDSCGNTPGSGLDAACFSGRRLALQRPQGQLVRHPALPDIAPGAWGEAGVHMTLPPRLTGSGGSGGLGRRQASCPDLASQAPAADGDRQGSPPLHRTILMANPSLARALQPVAPPAEAPDQPAQSSALPRGVDAVRAEWRAMGLADVDFRSELEPNLARQIGSGAFGDVFLASWRGMDVAVKIFNRGFGGATEEQEESFRQEVLMMTRLGRGCRQIVSIYGACFQQPHMALIYQYIPGGSLHDRIHGHGSAPLSYLEVLRIGRDLANGLSFLHPYVVHRDLKPMNILLDSDGTAMLIDFGVSRERDPKNSYFNTKAGGTPAYMAPEMFTGDKFSEKVDVYALACILCECLSRQSPWGTNSNFGAIVYAVSIMDERPEIPESCPERLQRLIGRCWDRNPHARPSCYEVLHKLRAMIAAEEARLACEAQQRGREQDEALHAQVQRVLRTASQEDRHGEHLADRTYSDTPPTPGGRH